MANGPADSSFGPPIAPSPIFVFAECRELASSTYLPWGYAKGQAGIELTTREQLGRQIHTLQLPPA